MIFVFKYFLIKIIYSSTFHALRNPLVLKYSTASVQCDDALIDFYFSPKALNNSYVSIFFLAPYLKTLYSIKSSHSMLWWYIRLRHSKKPRKQRIATRKAYRCSMYLLNRVFKNLRYFELSILVYRFLCFSLLD